MFRKGRTAKKGLSQKRLLLLDFGDIGLLAVGGFPPWAAPVPKVESCSSLLLVIQRRALFSLESIDSEAFRRVHPFAGDSCQNLRQ